MSIRFSAYFKIKNDTFDKLTDIQVVLRNENTYLFQCKDLEARASEGVKHGIAIDTGSPDYWTVTYTRHKKVWWIRDERASVKVADAGQVVEISIDEKKVRIVCPGSNKSYPLTSEQPS